MDFLTRGLEFLNSGWFNNPLGLSLSQAQWLLSTLCAAFASIISYNVLKFQILGDKAPERWSMKTLPIWIVMWLSKVTLLIGLVGFCWYLYKLQRNL